MPDHHLCETQGSYAYRYKCLLFGVSSASELYQHEISTALAGIEGVDNISDDIIVHCPDQKTHGQRLLKTMERIIQHGLTLNADKFLWTDWFSLEFVCLKKESAQQKKQLEHCKKQESRKPSVKFEAS